MFTSWRLRRVGEKSTRIEHFGRAQRGAPIALARGTQVGFPAGSNHRSVAALIILHIRRSPDDLPCCIAAQLQEIRPGLFPRGYFCKRKGDYFPFGQRAQFFDHADKRGKNCPSRNRPGGNQILPLSPFNAGSCPIVILPPILAAPALPLARFQGFQSCAGNERQLAQGSSLVAEKWALRCS